METVLTYPLTLLEGREVEAELKACASVYWTCILRFTGYRLTLIKGTKDFSLNANLRVADGLRITDFTLTQ